MISIALVLYLMFVHWIGDFICQTHWQATNKSSNNVALITHVGSWTMVMMAGLLSIYYLLPFTFTSFVLWGLANFILHFATDWVTSRINTRLWANNDLHNFFVSVGYDQWLHLMAILLTTYWIVL